MFARTFQFEVQTYLSDLAEAKKQVQLSLSLESNLSHVDSTSQSITTTTTTIAAATNQSDRYLVVGLERVLQLSYEKLGSRLPIYLYQFIASLKQRTDSTIFFRSQIVIEIDELQKKAEQLLYTPITTSGRCRIQPKLRACLVGTPGKCYNCQTDLYSTYSFGVYLPSTNDKCPKCGKFVAIQIDACDSMSGSKFMSICEGDLQSGVRYNTMHSDQKLSLIVPLELVNLIFAWRVKCFEVSGVLIPRTRMNQQRRKSRGRKVAVSTPFQYCLFVLDIRPTETLVNVQPALLESQLVKCEANQSNLLGLLVQSFQPALYGRCIEKLICLLIAASASRWNIDDDKPLVGIDRRSLHVILLGDAGVGKTKLMETMLQLCPIVEYLQARRTTKAGLNASVLRKEGQINVSAGALARVDGGVFCIDEIGEMPRIREILAQAMDTQIVSIAKAGIYTQFPARVAVMAACNAQTKNRDLDIAAGLEHNLGKAKDWLYNFDLVVTMVDQKSNASDRMMSTVIIDHCAPTSTTNTVSIDESDDNTNDIGNSDESEKSTSSTMESSSMSTRAPEPALLVQDRQCKCMDCMPLDDDIKFLHDNLLWKKPGAFILCHDYMRAYLLAVSKMEFPIFTAEIRAQLVASYKKLLESDISKTIPITPNSLATLSRLAGAVCRLLRRTTVTDWDLRLAVAIFSYIWRIANNPRSQYRRNNQRGSRKAATDRFVGYLTALGNDALTDEKSLIRQALAFGLTDSEAILTINGLEAEGFLLASGSQYRISLNR